MKITVIEKSVYGVNRFFADCPVSNAIVKVKGGKTLLESDVELLRQAGFTIAMKDRHRAITEFLPPNHVS